MNFMKLICFTLQVLSLTLLQAVISHQQYSYIKFNNLTQYFTAFKLMSDKCCSNKDSVCDIECKIKFKICLFELGDIKKSCLMDAEVNNPLAASSFVVILNKTLRNPLAMELTAVDENSPQVDDIVMTVSMANTPLRFNDVHWNYVSSQLTNGYLSFAYKLGCIPDWYGPVCINQCVAKVNRYTCSTNGERICLRGWYGEYCEKKCACSLTTNGRCLKDGTCECNKGWTGVKCNIDLRLCFTRKCLNGGKCHDNGTCHCSVSFTGRYCDSPIQTTSSSVLLHQTIMTSRQFSVSTSVHTGVATSVSSTPFASSTWNTTSIQYKQTTTLYQHTNFQTSSILVAITATLPVNASKSIRNASDSTLISESTSVPKTSLFHSFVISTTPEIKKEEKANIVIITSNIVIPVILTAIGFTFVCVMFIVWKLWRRKRLHRRKSQVSAIETIKQEEGSTSRPSTFNSNRSVSPLINSSYDKEVLGLDETTDDLETSSIATTLDEAEFTRRTYTLKEVDRICMMALKGSKSASCTATEKKKQTFEYLDSTKTFSNISFNSQRSSCRCSSGYESGSSSFSSSLQKRSPNSAQLTKDMLPTNDHNVDLHSSLSLQSECEENQHQIVNKQKVYFEGLPNFIVYREDTKV